MAIDIEVHGSQNVTVDVSTKQPTIEIKNTGAVVDIDVGQESIKIENPNTVVVTPLPNVSTEDNGKVLQVVEGRWAASELEITSGDVVDRVEALEEGLANVLYKEISITSFTNNVNPAEIGSTVTAVTLSWSFNKTPTSLMLDGESVSPTLMITSLSGVSISDKKTFTLKATDERGATTTKTTSINFYNRIRYGASTSYTDLDLSNGVLSNTKGRTFTVTAGEGQYIWYILPKRLGTCTFNAGGFDGGFTLFATETLTNASGYSEEYYIYKSDNAALGNTEVIVS